MRTALYLITILALLWLANHLTPGPGDADVRGPARAVTTWPWQTTDATAP